MRHPSTRLPIHRQDRVAFRYQNPASSTRLPLTFPGSISIGLDPGDFSKLIASSTLLAIAESTTIRCARPLGSPPKVTEAEAIAWQAGCCRF